MRTLPTHITIARTMKVLGVTRPTVNAMAMREQIRTEKIADRWLVVVSSLPKSAQQKLLATLPPDRVSP